MNISKPKKKILFSEFSNDQMSNDDHTPPLSCCSYEEEVGFELLDLITERLDQQVHQKLFRYLNQ